MPILLIALKLAFPDIHFGMTDEERCAAKREMGFFCPAEVNSEEYQGRRTRWGTVRAGVVAVFHPPPR